MLFKRGTSITVIIFSTHDNFSNFDLRNCKLIIVSSLLKSKTGEYVKTHSSFNSKVFLISRAGKLGLGSAYCEGYEWALDRKYDKIIQIDADFSHNPKYIPLLIDNCVNYDLVIGSRYISGVNVVNWPIRRLIISYGANIYTRLVTGLPVKDATGGFKCWKREVLESLDLDNVRSQGYSFQIEMTYRAWLQNFKIKEVPIIFVDRTIGESKMNRSVMLEAAIMIPRLRLWKFFGLHR